MLKSLEQGNWFARDDSIILNPNISYAALPLQGRAVTSNPKWGTPFLMCIIYAVHYCKRNRKKKVQITDLHMYDVECTSLLVLKRMVNLQVRANIQQAAHNLVLILLLLLQQNVNQDVSALHWHQEISFAPPCSHLYSFPNILYGLGEARHSETFCTPTVAKIDIPEGGCGKAAEPVEQLIPDQMRNLDSHYLAACSSRCALPPAGAWLHK